MRRSSWSNTARSPARTARNWRRTISSLIANYVDSGRVSYEFRSYAIHGVIDLPLTVLVKCDSPQTFFPLVEQIYANYEGIMKRAEAGNDQAKTAANLPAEPALGCPGRCLRSDRFLRRARAPGGPGPCLPRQGGGCAESSPTRPKSGPARGSETGSPDDRDQRRQDRYPRVEGAESPHSQRAGAR